MPQLSFKWAHPPSFDNRDFIRSSCNAQAAEFLDTWPQGALTSTALLTGPQASGKTHLTHSWAQRTQAMIIDPQAIGKKDSAALFGTNAHALLEDIHTLRDETALFHLLRHAETARLHLLLSSRAPASRLAFTLPDLRSRLMALPELSIGAPDTELLTLFLFKCFADRQLRVSQEVVEYLALRIERSFAAAQAIIERIEEQALNQKHAITIPFVKKLVG